MTERRQSEIEIGGSNAANFAPQVASPRRGETRAEARDSMPHLRVTGTHRHLKPERTGGVYSKILAVKPVIFCRLLSPPPSP